MRILRGFFGDEITRKTATTVPATVTSSDVPTVVSELMTAPPCSTQWCMPACGFCQKPLPSCHYTFTNIPKMEKSECHGIRSIFCCMISQIQK